MTREGPPPARIRRPADAPRHAGTARSKARRHVPRDPKARPNTATGWGDASIGTIDARLHLVANQGFERDEAMLSHNPLIFRIFPDVLSAGGESGVTPNCRSLPMLSLAVKWRISIRAAPRLLKSMLHLGERIRCARPANYRRHHTLCNAQLSLEKVA